METIDLVRHNLLSPVVLGFALGLVATLVRTDLRLPEEVYGALSTYLLLAIGLKGGAQLSQLSPSDAWLPVLATIGMGITIPVVVFVLARHALRLDVPDAGALAAHYGSVSVVTFVAAQSFVAAIGAPAEPVMATLVAILEVPGIVVGLALAGSRLGKRVSWTTMLHEVLAGRSIALLAGGLAIGALAGASGVERVAPFFVAPFEGALMLFLLHLGTLAGRRLRDFRLAGLPLVVFATAMPVAHGAVGVGVGWLIGLSLGGATVLGVMAASASYIAAPAAVRMSLPEANPGLYLTASLGITFPFNLTIGIPLYYTVARFIYAP